MNRRKLLQAIAACGVPMLVPRIALAAGNATADYGRLLVLIELKGGNDGLNTIVPFAAPAYARLRPRLALKREDVLQLDERTGAHPALQALQPLWQAGELAIVQSVGYPQPNLSHFRSIEIWDTAAASDQYLNDGWLARVFAAHPAPASYAADGIVVGASDLGPLAGTGARAVAIAGADQFQRQARFAAARDAAGRNGALRHLLKVEHDVATAAARIGSTHVFRTAFPGGPFGDAVKTGCQAIASGSGIAVLRLTLGGFDTHQNQPGTHAGLLRQLAEGIVALRAALQEIGRWQDTLVMTYAEFGRRPQENASLGTDHGTAAPHFVLGGRVRGGLHGAAPQLDRLDGNGNLPFAVDFRSLYASVLEDWWGVPSSAPLGGRFAKLQGLLA